MTIDLERLRRLEIWIAWVRLGAVPFAIFQVAASGNYPAGREEAAWATTAVLGGVAPALLWLSRRRLGPSAQRRLNVATLAFDTAVVSTFALIFPFEPGTPVRQLFFVPVIEGALKLGLWGAVGVNVAAVPVLAVFEHLRAERLEPKSFRIDYVTFQVGVQLLVGLIAGWLVDRMNHEAALAQTRATEAEQLRDALGRRADLLEGASRCARALSSSLELDQAFAAFIRELRGLVPNDRVGITLSDEMAARTIAAAGVGVDEVLAPGSIAPAGALAEEVERTGQTIYREDMADSQYPEEEDFVRVGLRSRLAAPLLVGARPIGMLSLHRRAPRAFDADEIELVSLLGRLAGTAVQNIRAYEAERETAEELRRLSTLRADFVSLVSHELRSPMAAVIGSAQTLQQRWRELAPEQRESFLALIADETSRLAALIGDVLDTSRIEAGTFTYSFSDVDVGKLLQESVALAQAGQDEVRVLTRIDDPLPSIRGDRERLRQVLGNLLDNAVKYSPTGGEVEVYAHADNGSLRVVVRDQGPGIASEHQRLIFEKFGRAHGGLSKPGSGLGLFIARSIAEAHGGSLEVRSAPERGAVFTLALPGS